jgi:hypothetical protein
MGPWSDGVIDYFDVPEGEDEGFMAAWCAEAPEAVLLRALRDDAKWRYASVPDAPDQGVLLLLSLDAWERLRPVLAGRQGFLGAQRHDNGAVVHWSSPLMYQRAYPGLEGALYVKVQP